MSYDYISGNLPSFQQNTLLCSDPNRLIHNVSTSVCGDMVTSFGMLRLSTILRCLRRFLLHIGSILTREWRSIDKISLCCTLSVPDYQELSHEERERFCKQVYLLRKRGYTIADVWAISFRRVLAESVAHGSGNAPCRRFW